MVGKNLLEHPKAIRHEVLAPNSNTLNLLDAAAVEAYLLESHPDMVIHAAGRVGGIQANTREPVRFLVENFDMGRNVVLAARAVAVPQLINLGSSCMYPRDRDTPLTEGMIGTGELEPTNEGYALAKIAVARLCSYVKRETPACNYKTVIPCNLYGRHDKFDPAWSHLVPAILYKLHAARIAGQSRVEIWGDGNARREFMYAGDLADALFFAVDDFETMPDLMNIGVGADYSVNDYYQIAAEVVGYTGEFAHDLGKPVGMMRKLTSIGLCEAWGWRAKTSLKDGLQKTYDYFLELEAKK
jgi:GDP-L-fucose synthase